MGINNAEYFFLLSLPIASCKDGSPSCAKYSKLQYQQTIQRSFAPRVSIFDRLSLYFAVTNADRSFLVLQMPHERYFLCNFNWGWFLSF